MIHLFLAALAAAPVFAADRDVDMRRETLAHSKALIALDTSNPPGNEGANDTNVPLAEAEHVFKRLKKLGRDASLVVYPDEGHGFTRRKNLTDYYERTVAFFSAKLTPK